MVTASARSLPALTYSIDEDMLANMTCTCPPSGSTSAGTRAAIRHVHEVDAGHHFEQFNENMVSGTDAARPHVDLAGIDFGIGDELGNRVDRHRRIHLYGEGVTRNAGNRRDVADEIEIELVVERCVTRIWKTSQQKRIAVRGCIHDRLGGDIGASTRPVLDHEWLAKPRRQPLSYQACHDVGATSGGKSDNDAHRSRRISLRPRDARHSRERGSTRGQMQKSSAGKFQVEPPSHHSITSSARASSVGGTVRPSILAVLRLMLSANLVGCSTGKSPGFAPFRILSTCVAARRKRSGMLGP